MCNDFLHLQWEFWWLTFWQSHSWTSRSLVVGHSHYISLGFISFYRLVGWERENFDFYILISDMVYKSLVVFFLFFFTFLENTLYNSIFTKSLFLFFRHCLGISQCFCLRILCKNSIESLCDWRLDLLYNHCDNHCCFLWIFPETQCWQRILCENLGREVNLLHFYLKKKKKKKTFFFFFLELLL